MESAITEDSMFHAFALAVALFGTPAAPAASSCDQLSLQCDRCNPRQVRQLDALQTCSKVLFAGDETRCAARLKPTRAVCR
jgi:hypothetical protein